MKSKRWLGYTPKERLLRIVYVWDFGGYWFARIDSGEKPENINLEPKMDWERVYGAVKDLPGREGIILFLRAGVGCADGRPKTLQETADELHVSRERIRQIEARAIRRFRSKIPFKTAFLGEKG